MRAHAFVSDTRATRGVATVLGWLVAKSFAEQIFESPTRAAGWLGGQITGLPIDAALADIRARVDPLVLHPDLSAA